MKTLTLATDNELIRLFQSGSNGALEVLVCRHKDNLFTSILMLVKDKYLAEDLFQEVFFEIIDLLRSNGHNEEVSFLNWATRIAYKFCIDHIQKVQKTPAITVVANDSDVFKDNTIEDSCESSVFKDQLQGELLNLSNSLTDAEREVIVLRHFGDVSFKEIVAMTRRNVHTVVMHMRNGLFSLRKIMEEKQIAY